MRISNYAAEPLLRTCGITINNEFMQVEGRVLAAPELEFGDGEDFPRNGRWNVKDKKFSNPVTIKDRVVVNFSARCNIFDLCRDLVKCGEMKGIEIPKFPLCTFEEDPQYRRAPPPVRVDKMADQVMSRLRYKPPTIILCVFADRKNSEIYGPWKKKALVELGVVSQCLAPQRANEHLGGVNHRLAVERNIPVLIDKPIIFGMDVYHGSPGQSGVPSIAAVVSSRPSSIYRYRASVRSQSPKVEMIESLYKPLPTGEDGGIFRLDVHDICFFNKELLEEFYKSSRPPVKPSQVIVFRDGVSESQFKQVLNIEFEQILQACTALGDSWSPKYTIIIAQKNHHTKFFQQERPKDNVPPGTVGDSKVCDPRYYDFYMCAQNGMIGTSRPTHYHVLLDQNAFTADELQELIHSLSYV
ncbi:protein argonaute 4A-like [Chenopodium quinoa]|uniref:protein argonaute 4A-like n=1 Tax=Chenopodium quinoa TaxID=63459 RepID=UPI000B792E2A|nr:protein argonaute 4A-like [Chenopodium quinoa]